MVTSVSIPTRPTTAPVRVLTYAELANKIREEAGLEVEEIDQLRVGEKYVVSGVTWQVHQPPPGGASELYTIHAIFEHPKIEDGETDPGYLTGDIRVYCQPRKIEGGFACYVLNRAQPMSLYCYQLKAESFVREVAEEWAGLAVLTGVVDDDSDSRECVLCKSSTEDDEAKFCSTCGAALPSVAT